MNDIKKQLLDEICQSISDGDMVTFKQLLSDHPYLINLQVYEGTVISQSLLHYAASEGRREMCMLLIENGMDVNLVDYSYMTPLDYPASKGDIILVREFILKGACVDGDSRGITTPLISASREGHYEIVEYLIECGADINRIQSNHNRTALDIAIAHKTVYDNERIIELLKSKGALSAHEPIDFTSERAAVVLGTIHSEAGWVLSNKINRNSIDVRTALLKSDKNNKILFTIGAFQQKPKTEVMICMPANWPVNRQLVSENTLAAFPVQLLFAVAEHRLAGGELHEGFIIERQDEKWSSLVWPEKIDGFIAVDYEFGGESDPSEYSDETIKLLMLVPIKYPKSGCPQGKKLDEWIEKRRTAKWANNALKYDHLNDEKRI